MSAPPAPPADVKEFKGGELLMAGGTDWAQLGKSGPKGKKSAQDVQVPSRRWSALAMVPLPLPNAPA